MLAPIQMETVIVTLFGPVTPLLGYVFYRYAEYQARQRGTLAKDKLAKRPGLDATLLLAWYFCSPRLF